MIRCSFALVLVASLCGCAIRYSETGITRVGIGLWGFGDPPGVNWNLDWPPRRDVPELPPMGSRESLELPRVNRSPADDALTPRRRNFDAGPDVVIDDNRCRAVHSDAFAHFSPVPPRTDSLDSLAGRT